METETSAQERAGGIVDAVSHHAHCFAGFLQLLDKAGLIFRQNLGTVFRDAQLAADGAGCGFAVPP